MKSKIAVVVILILVTVALCGCPSSFFGDDNMSSTKIQVAIAPQPKVEYTSGLGYMVKISGALQNITNSRFTYVSITFTLYDENGYVIGSAMDNMNYLDAGGTWKYEAVSFQWFDIPPASYKCTEILCY